MGDNIDDGDLVNSLNSTTQKLLASLKILRISMIDEETFTNSIIIADSIKRPHPTLHSISSNISAEELILYDRLFKNKSAISC